MTRKRKLSEQQVIYIRYQWDCLRRPTRELAKEFGVSPQTIWAIRYGRIYRDVPWIA